MLSAENRAAPSTRPPGQVDEIAHAKFVAEPHEIFVFRTESHQQKLDVFPTEFGHEIMGCLDHAMDPVRAAHHANVTDEMSAAFFQLRVGFNFAVGIFGAERTMNTSSAAWPPRPVAMSLTDWLVAITVSAKK